MTSELLWQAVDRPDDQGFEFVVGDFIHAFIMPTRVTRPGEQERTPAGRAPSPAGIGIVRSAHSPRIFAFWAANSSSVRTPLWCSSPSDLS